MKSTPLLVALALALLLAWLARGFAVGSERSGAAPSAAAPEDRDNPAGALLAVGGAALEPTAGRATAPAHAPEPTSLAEVPSAEPRGLEDGARPPAIAPPELQAPRGSTGAGAD